MRKTPTSASQKFYGGECCDGARPSNSTEASLSFCVVTDFVIVRVVPVLSLSNKRRVENILEIAGARAQRRIVAAKRHRNCKLICDIVTSLCN